MKKTLVTILALCTATLGMANTLEETTTLTATTNVSTSSNGTENKGYPNSNNATYGYTFSFGSQQATFKSDGQTITDFSVYDSLGMSSVTLKSTGSAEIIKLAVYEVGSSYTLSYVGLSNAGTLVGGEETTFTFDSPLTFNTNTTYAFIYVKSSATEETLTALTTADNVTDFNVQSTTTTTSTDAEGNVVTDTLDGYAVSSDLVKIRMEHTWSMADSSGVAEWRGVNFTTGAASWTAGQVPTATYTFTATRSVPEPATATLGLLALAGLAARRRRK